MKPSELRALIHELDGEHCCWPTCPHRGTEIAHFHSKGMGGTPDGRRNAVDCQGLMCYPHARMSDGLQPGGWPAYKRAHQALLGDDYEERITPDRVAYERAEALTRLVAERRGQ